MEISLGDLESISWLIAVITAHVISSHCAASGLNLQRRVCVSRFVHV